MTNAHFYDIILSAMVFPVNDAMTFLLQHLDGAEMDSSRVVEVSV